MPHLLQNSESVGFSLPHLLHMSFVGAAGFVGVGFGSVVWVVFVGVWGVWVFGAEGLLFFMTTMNTLATTTTATTMSMIRSGSSSP